MVHVSLSAPAPAAHEGPRGVYVVGPGRGGSTLFERVLNTSPTAFALGEFHCLWRLDRARILCACGQPFDRCGFWGAVMQRSGLGDAGLARMRVLEKQVARSLFVLRARFSLATMAADPAVREYLALQDSVWNAVGAESGARYLIDTSKAGPRAWLVATDPRNLVVQLHRDAVEVLTSWRQPKWNPALNGPMRKPSVAHAALDWWKAEAWGSALAGRRPVQRVVYDELVARPREVIAQAFAASAPGLAEGIAWQDERSVRPAAVYHSLNGNPDRFDAGQITISARPPSIDKLPTRDRLAVRLIGGWLDRVAP